MCEDGQITGASVVMNTSLNPLDPVGTSEYAADRADFYQRG